MPRLQLIIFLIGVILAACEQSPPPYLTLAESKSPDGKWIDDAVTTQDSGAGQFGFHTAVYLKSLSDPRNPQMPPLQTPTSTAQSPS